MNLLDEADALLATVNPPAAPVESPGQFGRGLRSGWEGSKSQLHSFAGAVGEAAGFDDFAKNRNADAAALNIEAQKWAPRVQSYKDVNGLRDAYDYATGLVGQSAPVTGAALGAGLLTGGGALPMMAAGTLATAPFEIGDVIQRQRNDPEAMKLGAGERLAQAGASGLVSAATQSIVPAIVGGKVLGTGVRAAQRSVPNILGRGVLDAGLEGVTEGAGEVVKQGGVMLANPNKPMDWDAVAENAIGGAAAGGALGSVGVAGDLAHKVAAVPGGAFGGVKDAIKDFDIAGKAKAALGATKEAAQDFAGNAKETVGNAAEGYDISGTAAKVRERFEGAGNKATEVLKRMADGEDVVDLSSIKGKSQEFIRDNLPNLDGEAVAHAITIGKKLMADAGLTPERRAQVGELMKDLSSKANRTAIAGLAKASQASKKVADLARAAAKAAREEHPDGSWQSVNENENDLANARSTKKKSASTKGTMSLLMEPATQGLARARPGVEVTNDAITDLSESLMITLSQIRKGNATYSPTMVENLKTLLGDELIPTLQGAYRKLDQHNPEERQRVNDALLEFANQQGRDRKIIGMMRDALGPNSHIDDDVLRETVADLRKYAAGRTEYNNVPSKASEAQLAHQQLIFELDKHLGVDAADQVMKEIEKDYKKSTKKNAMDREEAPDYDEHLDKEDTLRDKSDPASKLSEIDGSKKVETIYYGKERTDADTQKRHYDGAVPKSSLDEPLGQAKQAMERAARENPGKNVEFRTIREIERSPYGEAMPNLKQFTAEFYEKYEDVDIGADEIKAAMEKAKDEWGVVVAEGTKQNFGLTKRDLYSLELRRKNAEGGLSNDYKNAARLESGGRILDAVKLTRRMEEQFKDDYTDVDRKSDIHRKTRMFLEGVAALQMLHSDVDSQKFSDDLLIAPNLTWGVAKKLDMSPETDRMSARGKKKLAELRKQYKDATPDEREEILAQVQDIHKYEHDRELGADVEKPTAQRSAPSEQKLTMPNPYGLSADTVIGRTEGSTGGTETRRADPRVKAMARLDRDHDKHKRNAKLKADREGYEIKKQTKTGMGEYPFDGSYDDRYDADTGMLTRAGAAWLMGGDAHGGIETTGTGSHGRFSRTENETVWDGGETKTKPGKRMREQTTSADPRLLRAAAMRAQAEAITPNSDANRARITRLTLGAEALEKVVAKDSGAGEGQGRREVDPFGPTHDAMRGQNEHDGIGIESSGNARGSEVVERKFGKGGRLRNSEIITLTEKFRKFAEEGKSEGTRSVGERGLRLMEITNNMNDHDHGRLSKLLLGVKPSDVSAEVASLSKKYAKQLAASEVAAGGIPKGRLENRLIDRMRLMDSGEVGVLVKDGFEKASDAVTQGGDAVVAAKDQISDLTARVIGGDDKARLGLWSLMNSIDQLMAHRSEQHANARVQYLFNRKPDGTPLSDYMGLIIEYGTDEVAKLVAKAVRKTAGSTVVRAGSALDMGTHTNGMFKFSEGDIHLNPMYASSMYATVLHEGAHAATMKAIINQPELHGAFFDLLNHVTAVNPRLGVAYGGTNVAEFIAEGLSNPSFQRMLQAIPASKDVDAYLSLTLKDAWTSFVGLVRKALGIPASEQNALTQLFDLSGQAMKATAKAGSNKIDIDEFAELGNRRLVSAKDGKAMAGQINYRGDDADAIRAAVDKFVADKSKTGFTVSEFMVLAALREYGDSNPTIAPAISLDRAKDLLRFPEMISVSLFGPIGSAPSGFNPSGRADAEEYRALRTESRMALEIHEALERPGFAATHDSPTPHEGKFDWRAHKGKGEGHATFGEGTYLSTDEEVHKSYKDQFTAKIRYDATQTLKNDPEYKKLRDELSTLYKTGLVPAEKISAITDKMFAMEDAVRAKDPKSPTYEVSVDIAQDELLDWNKKMSEQPQAVRDAVTSAATASGVIKARAYVRGGNSETWYSPAIYGMFDATGFNSAGAAAPTAQDALTNAAAYLDSLSGQEIYHALKTVLGSQRNASEALQAAGILGHKYAAAGGSNDNHPNYVIYDDSKITNNYVHFSRQGVNPGAAGPRNVAQALANIARTLANSVQVNPNAPINHAGEFTVDQRTGQAIIRLSVHALDPVSVAYHESLHAFFKILKDQKNHEVWKTLEKAAMAPGIQSQLRTLLAGERDALAQLSEPEEAAAYMYQFWAAGQLQIGNQTKSVFTKIAEWIKKAMGIWTNDERALEILDYFHSGQFAPNIGNASAVRNALVLPGHSASLEFVKSLTQPIGSLAEALASAGAVRLRDTGIPALRELADAMKLPIGKGGNTGFIQAARTERSKIMNKLARDLHGFTADELDTALEDMQSGNRTPNSKSRQIKFIVQGREDANGNVIGGLLPTMLEYMRAKGVDVGHLSIDSHYFPRVWDTSFIAGHQDEFLNMLERYHLSGQMQGDPRRVLDKLIAADGGEFTVETNRPGQQHLKGRILDFISDADAAPFMRKHLHEILFSYVNQSTRRAEWADRFGDNGEVIGEMMLRAKREGATAADINAAWEYVRAIDGTLGDGSWLTPSMRRMMGNMIVYQNIRLLPLAIFSSIVDPIGIMVRGGEIRDAWDTFKRGIIEVKKNFEKEEPAVTPGTPAARRKRETEFAETMGVIDSATLIHTIGASYSQGMVGDTGRLLNDGFFRYNLMEQFNRSMRVGASQAALKFLHRHGGLVRDADGNAVGMNKHSERWMRELGFEPGEYTGDWNDPRTHAAVNRWVDGAVLRPDAADKPIWMSDPRWMLVSHLKQFVFSFQETILKRVIHEYKNGNTAPAMALASYIPTMLAADMIKGMVQGGGDTPEWKKNWGPSNYIGYATERAGVFGVSQYGLDTAQHGIGGLLGPTVEQLASGVKVAAGTESPGHFALKSMPANALYADYASGGKSANSSEARTN